MYGILGLIQGDRLVLWRRFGRRLVPWTTVIGEPERLLLALRSARELDELADGFGGWAQVFHGGLHALEPRQLMKVAPRVLLEHDLDRGFR